MRDHERLVARRAGAPGAAIAAATFADALGLSKFLREADRRELLAAAGPRDPLDILVDGLRTSDASFCARAQSGAPICIWGVRNVGPVAVAWMLASVLMPNHARAMVALAPTAKAATLAAARAPLWNLVDERNALHVRWLRWLGAEFSGRRFTRADPDVPFSEFFIR